MDGLGGISALNISSYLAGDSADLERVGRRWEVIRVQRAFGKPDEVLH